MLDWTGKPLRLARFGAIGAAAAFLPGEVVMSSSPPGSPSLFRLLITSGLWIGIYGIGCTTALVMGQNRYLHRPWLDVREAMIALGGGLLAGFISGAAAQFFFSMALTIGQGSTIFGEAARVLAWGMFGALIGFGMSFIIPNLGRQRGLSGGGVAGVIGGLCFLLGTLIGNDLVGRLIGMTAVGFVLGYAIGLVEEAARTAWLQVAYGQSREIVRVSLGPELVCVGSNPQRCAIWAQGARSIALRFRYVDGRVVCDDMTSERTGFVESGFQQQVGNVNVLVCVGTTAGGVGAPARQATSVPPAVPAKPPVPPSPAVRVAAPSISTPVRPMAGPRQAPPPPPPPPPAAKR